MQISAPTSSPRWATSSQRSTLTTTACTHRAMRSQLSTRSSGRSSTCDAAVSLPARRPHGLGPHQVSRLARSELLYTGTYSWPVSSWIDAMTASVTSR